MSSASQVFRASTWFEWIGAFAGGLLFVAGVAVLINASGKLEAGVLLLVFGGISIVVSRVAIVTRFEVGPTGITRTPDFLGFHMPWDQVTSWTVVSADTINDETCREFACFHVAGKRSYIRISDTQVANPGFALFLEAVRAAIGDRENDSHCP